MHIDQTILHDYIKLNKQHWDKHKNTVCDHGEICIVHGVWENKGQFIISSDFIAKSVQHRTGLPISSLSCGVYHSLTAINESFGIQTNCLKHIWVSVLRRIILRICAEIITRFGGKKTICKIKLRGMHIGDLVYDYVLRCKANEENSFDMDHLANSRDVLRVYTCLLNAERSYIYCIIHKPRYVISRGIQGEPGIITQVLYYMGADFISNDVLGDLLPVISANGDMREKVKINSILYGFYRKMIAQYEMPDGAEYDEEDLFIVCGDDYDGSREDFCNAIQADPKKKNILILPHCLSDCSRMNCLRRYYIDYHEWLLDTLKQISKIKHVNWIIKEHPHASAYGQEEYIKKLYEKYHKINPGILWLDKSISGKSLSKMVDVVITDAGDAGCEYVAYGVPTVTCQNTAYARMGVSNNAKNKKQYYEMLKGIDKIPLPDRHQIRISRKIMNILKSSFDGTRIDDPVFQLCEEQERKLSENLKKSSNFSTDNTYFFTKLIALYKEKKIDSCFYVNYPLEDMRI